MFKEAIAIKVITGIISQWEKIQTKLENAIDSLREVISQNKTKIRDIENKNITILAKIDEAEKFKSNAQKMLG